MAKRSGSKARGRRLAAISASCKGIRPRAKFVRCMVEAAAHGVSKRRGRKK